MELDVIPIRQYASGHAVLPIPDRPMITITRALENPAFASTVAIDQSYQGNKEREQGVDQLLLRGGVIDVAGFVIKRFVCIDSISRCSS